MKLLCDKCKDDVLMHITTQDDIIDTSNPNYKTLTIELECIECGRQGKLVEKIDYNTGEILETKLHLFNETNNTTEWFEVFIDKGEGEGTETIISFEDKTEAISYAKEHKEYNGLPLKVDRWTSQGNECPEPQEQVYPIKKQNIKILVVPTETGNNIDQNSTVKEILLCTETKIFDSVGQVFQLLNDEELTDRYWYFLVDMDTKEHLNEH